MEMTADERVRKELVNELKKEFKDSRYPLKDHHTFLYTELADFIISDRKRIYQQFIKELKNLPIIRQPIKNEGFKEEDLWKVINKYKEPL